MNSNPSYHIQKMKECLSQKQRQNAQYSVRAFARDIEMHPATLNQVLNGKRPLPLKNCAVVAEKMGLSPKERTLFMDSLFRTKSQLDSIKVSESDERFMLDESYHKVIAEWEHYAVIELYDTNNFTATVGEIARRLGITENRAGVVLNNLFGCGLLVHGDNGLPVKSHRRVRTTEDVTSNALKASHIEALEMGKEKLTEIDVMLRDFSSSTLAIDMEKLPEAKQIIREFRQKMAALLEEGNKTEVFQLAIQFYPLTQIENIN